MVTWQIIIKKIHIHESKVLLDVLSTLWQKRKGKLHGCWNCNLDDNFLAIHLTSLFLKKDHSKSWVQCTMTETTKVVLNNLGAIYNLTFKCKHESNSKTPFII